MTGNTPFDVGFTASSETPAFAILDGELYRLDGESLALKNIRSLGPQRGTWVVASPFNPKHLLIRNTFDSMVSYDGGQSFLRIEGSSAVTFINADGLLVMQFPEDHNLYMLQRGDKLWQNVQQPDLSTQGDLFAAGSGRLWLHAKGELWRSSPIGPSGQAKWTPMDLDALPSVRTSRPGAGSPE